MTDEKDILTEEQEEEAEEIELNTDTKRGDVRDNPMNTRKNHIITAIWLALLVIVLAGVDYANRLCENEGEEVMAVVVGIQCENVYGVSMDYGLNRHLIGGQVCTNDPMATVPLPKGDAPRFRFTEWDIGEGKSVEDGPFFMTVSVMVENENEVLIEELWEWQAAEGGEYRFTLTGDAECGFELHAEDEAAYSVMPLDELPEGAIQ